MRARRRPRSWPAAVATTPCSSARSCEPCTAITPKPVRAVPGSMPRTITQPQYGAGRTAPALRAACRRTLYGSSVPHEDARIVAFVERHPPFFPDAIAAVGELIRVLGDVAPFLLIGQQGRWEQACAVVEPSFRPSRWLARRVLPAGEWRLGHAEGLRAE